MIFHGSTQVFGEKAGGFGVGVNSGCGIWPGDETKKENGVAIYLDLKTRQTRAERAFHPGIIGAAG